MISFFIFLSISVLTLIVNIAFYLNREFFHNHPIYKILLIILMINSTIFLIVNLPYFILNDSKLFLDIDYEVILPTILFNLSIILFFSSIILNLLVFLAVDESIVILEIPSRLSSKRGDIPIGRILKGKIRKQQFFLSLKDLEKHMFICGATGTGKSNFLRNFLINFSKIFKIPFFLVEFKGEYHFLQKKIEDVLIYWPGENFSINIFNPGNANPMIHAERIFDILKSGKFIDENSEFSPQMEKVLVEILTKVCKSKKFQNWEGFEHYCEEYLRENKRQIPMLNQTLISIKNRIRRFSKGPLKALFEDKDCTNMGDLFKQNILLDLSSIIRLGGEKEDALFFLNMILKYLWDKNLMKGAYDYKGIKHLTIIEEAQYFAPQGLIKKNKITSYLEDIALLQRGTGECLITLATRPDISKEILANNGVVLTFKNHLEKDIMCELMNLDIENRNYLSILEEGQCIIRVNSVKEPFLLGVPYIKNESMTFKEIYRNNENILEKKREYLDSYPKFKSKYQFPRLSKLINFFFSLKLKNNNTGETNTVKSIKVDPINIKSAYNSENDILDHNLEEKSFETLKNYINKLKTMQNEKE